MCESIHFPEISKGPVVSRDNPTQTYIFIVLGVSVLFRALDQIFCTGRNPISFTCTLPPVPVWV